MRVTVTIFKYIEPNNPSMVTWQLDQQHADGEIYSGSVTCRIDEPTPPVFQRLIEQGGWQTSGLDNWSVWRKVVDMLKQPPGAYIPDATSN